ncbi:hypothetical protein ACFCZT_38580 [Streptomyces sp. NPDC056230]|uniref:hypothetical protein n=1 Tax=Streptomyces sp. NPDC056230 TaxID=3345754 RepID=UPI0035DBAEB2
MSEPTDALADSVPGPRPTPAATAPSAPAPSAAASAPAPAPKPQMRYVDVTGSREAAGRGYRISKVLRQAQGLLR